MSDFITLAEYKEAVGINSVNSDTAITALIPRVSAFIKNHCNRSLIDYATTASPKTEIATLESASMLHLIEAPIISVVSVSESYDYGQTYTALAEYSDYAVDRKADAIVRIGNYFPDTVNGVKVVYTGGYTEAPSDLKAGAIELLTYFLKHEGVPRKNTAATHLQIEYITSGNLPAHIARLLDNYRYINL